MPPLIQRALARVWNPQLELTSSERVALAALVARAEARDGSREFWVRRANLAALFGRVDRTISAWLKALEDRGWIVKEQGRTNWGSFQCLTVHLTAKAQAYLGLNAGAPTAGLYRKKTSAGIENQDKQSSSKRHPAGPVDNRPDSERDHDGVPADLAALRSLGLSPRAIFALMRTASSHGKRLGELVAAKGAYLGKARNLYAVLSKFCRDGIDHVAVEKGRAEDQAKRQATEQARTDYSVAIREYEGHFTRGKRGELLYVRGGLPEVHDTGGPMLIVGAAARAVLTWLGQNKPPRFRTPGEAMAGSMMPLRP